MTRPPILVLRSRGSQFLIRLFGQVVHLSILTLCYLFSLLDWLGQGKKSAG